MTTSTSISVNPRRRRPCERGRALARSARCRHRADYNPPVRAARGPRAALSSTSPPPCPDRFASSPASSRSSLLVARRARRRCVVVARAAAAAAGLAVRVRREAGRERSSRSRASSAAAGVLPREWPLVALARVRGVDRAIKAGNYEIATGITLPRLLDQADAGRRHADRADDRRRLDVRRARRALAADPAVAKTVLDAAGRRARGGASASPGASPRAGSFPTPISSPPARPTSALLARAHRLMRARLDAAWANARRRTCRSRIPTRR